MYVGATLLLERFDGRMIDYKHEATRKEVSTQQAFFGELVAFFGVSDAAATLAQKKKLQSAVGLAIGLVLAGLYVWYRLY